MYGVGTHVGDQTHSAAAGVDTFIKLLSRAHGALRGEAQFTHRLLLQRGGGKGCGRVAFALLFLNLVYTELAIGRFQQSSLRGMGAVTIGDAELLQLLSFVVGQLGGEGLVCLVEIGFYGPVFPGLEGLDLLFAFDDQS